MEDSEGKIITNIVITSIVAVVLGAIVTLVAYFSSSLSEQSMRIEEYGVELQNDQQVNNVDNQAFSQLQNKAESIKDSVDKLRDRHDDLTEKVKTNQERITELKAVEDKQNSKINSQLVRIEVIEEHIKFLIPVNSKTE